MSVPVRHARSGASQPATVLRHGTDRRVQPCKLQGCAKLSWECNSARWKDAGTIEGFRNQFWDMAKFRNLVADKPDDFRMRDLPWADIPNSMMLTLGDGTNRELLKGLMSGLQSNNKEKPICVALQLGCPSFVQNTPTGPVSNLHTRRSHS